MKRFILWVAVLAGVCGFLSGCGKKAQVQDTSLESIKQRGVFVLGLDDSFPPMGFRNEAGEIVGFDIDMAKQVAARLGLDFVAQPIDWDAKEMELTTGKIDCIWNGFTITPERQEALEWTKPYLDNNQVLVVKADSNIKTLQDAKGKVIGLQSGSSAQDALEANKDFSAGLKDKVMFKDNVTALNDLEIGGIDGVVMDSVVAEYSIAQTKKPFVVIQEPLAVESYGVAFRKGDIALRDAVQQTLDAMQATGTTDQIKQKWFQ